MGNTYCYIRTSRQRLAGEAGSDPEAQALWASIDRLANWVDPRRPKTPRSEASRFVSPA